MKISKRIGAINASPTLAMAAKAQQLKAEGVDVISMSLGEPDFATPDHVKQAVKDAVDANFSHYGPVPGQPGLRAAVADYMSKTIDPAHRYEAKDVVVSVGAKQAICEAIEAIIDPGDEVLLPTPCWVSYQEMVKLAEGTPVDVPTTLKDNFKLTPEALEKAITDKTKLILLCSPSNPTGSVYTRAEIRALADVLLRHPDIALIADEVYQEICYTDEFASWGEITELHDRLIVISAVSKAYAMTGYRIGWLVCKNAAFIKAVTRLQGQAITCATMVAQKAAEAALRDDQQCVRDMTAAFRRRRDLIVRLAREIPGLRFETPDGAFYLFPDATYYFGKSTPDGKKITDMDGLCEYILTEGHVATVSGAAFGEPTCFRMSYAMADEQIIECMKRIKACLSKLQ